MSLIYSVSCIFWVVREFNDYILGNLVSYDNLTLATFSTALDPKYFLKLHCMLDQKLEQHFFIHLLFQLIILIIIINV